MSIKKFWIVIPLILILFAGFGCDEKSEDEILPVIERIQVSPTVVPPNGAVSLTVTATSEIEGDTLDYFWRSSFGSFPYNPIEYQVIWYAPRDLGTYPVICEVSNNNGTVTDTAFVVVDMSLSTKITQPNDNSVFTTNDTLNFAGWITGYEIGDILNMEVRWESDISGILNTELPDTFGQMGFLYPGLPEGQHKISLSIIRNLEVATSDTVDVEIVKVAPFYIYPIERNYITNKITWSRFEEARDYRLVRHPGGMIATMSDEFDTTFVDSNIVLGREYIYQVFSTNASGISAETYPEPIVAGVYTEYESNMTDMYYDNQTQYLYCAFPGLDYVYAIDVLGNNVDYGYWWDDFADGSPYEVLFSPYGFAANELGRDLFVSSTGDSAIWRIDLDSHGFARSVNFQEYGSEPQFMTFDENNNILYATLNNRFPVIIENPYLDPNAFNKTFIYDTRLIVNSSQIFYDDDRSELYISEIGSFPSSMYKFSTLSGTPVLIQEDEHGQLGYGLFEFALTPDGNELFVASYSPHYVQILSPSNFQYIDQLPTGESPNSVVVSSNGQSVYTSSNRTVSKWDRNSRALIWSRQFEDPVRRGGLQVSDDESLIMISTGVSNDSRVFLIFQNL